MHDFLNADELKVKLKENGFSQATILAFNHGKQISLESARRLEF